MGGGAVLYVRAEGISYRGVGDESQTDAYLVRDGKLHGDIVKAASPVTVSAGVVLTPVEREVGPYVE